MTTEQINIMQTFLIIFFIILSISFILSICANIPKVPESYRGYDNALESISNGECPFTLYTQSMGEIYPSGFDYGWKEACLKHMTKEQKEFALELDGY